MALKRLLAKKRPHRIWIPGDLGSQQLYICFALATENFSDRRIARTESLPLDRMQVVWRYIA